MRAARPRAAVVRVASPWPPPAAIVLLETPPRLDARDLDRDLEALAREHRALVHEAAAADPARREEAPRSKDSRRAAAVALAKGLGLGRGLRLPRAAPPSVETKAPAEAEAIREGNRCSAAGITAARHLLAACRIRGGRLVHKGSVLTSERLKVSLSRIACIEAAIVLLETPPASMHAISIATLRRSLVSTEPLCTRRPPRMRHAARRRRAAVMPAALQRLPSRRASASAGDFVSREGKSGPPAGETLRPRARSFT